MADLNDNVLESEYSKKEFNIDAHLKYGRYQAIRVWIFGSILGASSVLFYRFTKNILNVFKQNCSDSLSSRLVFSVFGTSLWWYQLQRLFQSVPSPALYIVKQKWTFFPQLLLDPSPTPTLSSYYLILLTGLVQI